MILQALNKYYDCLVEKGELEKPGWQAVKVSFSLQLNDDGTLKRVAPLFHEEERGKKKVLIPRVLNVPAQEKRAVGIVSNFLCDNSSYVLGVDAKGKPERSLMCFAACSSLHKQLLASASSMPARVILHFFNNWDPSLAHTNEALKPYWDDILAGANLTFEYQGHYAVEDAEIKSIWDAHYSSSGEGEKLRCLVTGTFGPVARLHPSIRGIAGGQPSGTSLVSFNASAFESFGRDGAQGYNAPVSEKAAFAYTAALNYMIAKPKHHLRLSDTTIVFWAENGDDSYSDMLRFAMEQDSAIDEQTLFDALRNIAAGRNISFDEHTLTPDEHFYILGLAPNSARLSVRYFIEDSFGQLAKRLLEHFEHLNITKPSFEARTHPSFWQLLNETVNQKSRDKTPSPVLSAALVRAVLSGLPYPPLLFSQTQIRIRADRNVSWLKAAIIKAYLLRLSQTGMLNPRYKEVLTVELNPNTDYPPYLLGRLFSVLEELQIAAMRKDNPTRQINATIRDRFFNSACANPAVVFPQLLKLAQAHLKKLGGGLEVVYNSKIGTIMESMHQSYPTSLSLYDQGIFQLGYYHQTQARYAKKEENENV